MELTHKLTYNNTTTVIDEPIGFDDLQSTIKRHDYHGMGAEVSLGNLEFYWAAFNIIAGAYAADIDSEVLYEVLAGTDIIYSGKLDLSTYSVKQGDYRSVSVKVGEIGAKTTFNNRTDKEVDLNTPKTIDGEPVEAPDWINLHIPMKHLLYTNIAKQKEDKTIGLTKATPSGTTTDVTLDNSSTNEFGKINESGTLFMKDEDFDVKFGENTEITIDAFIHAEINTLDVIYYGGTIEEMSIRLKAGNRILATSLFDDYHVGGTATLSYQGTVPTETLILEIYCKTTADVYSWNASAIIHQSSVKMTMYDTITEDNPVNADMLLVHDALNVVSHAISENALAVKSDWYRTQESKWNAGSIGGGALKALTNGYKIRGLFTDGETKRNMPLSFKYLIENLSALDCIGWGFSKEDGVDCVRVERWDWFYKDDVILTLDNVNDIQIDVDTDRIPTELKIGYKKYATQDQYNSIDSPYGTRTYNNAIKALSKSLVKECEFVADNYAIEETRRARTQVSETEETTYDENIFVLELTRAAGVEPIYKVDHTAVNAENVGKANEFINAKLTPRHMAVRWLNYLFATNNNTPFRFTTGEINYRAKFGVIPAYQIVYGRQFYSLDPGDTDPTTARIENEDLPYTPAKFKAEKITFSYPLTIEQYKTVKANPYGIIRATDVDGVTHDGWIMDFRYSFQDGMADFTLIAKN